MEGPGFRVLGPVRVCTGDRSVPPAGPRQERVLAALLLDAGRVVPVERLVDVVWDGEPPATATRQVRNVTTALRRALLGAGFAEDVLTAEGPGFVLRPPWLDLHEFEALAERGEYREALACWRGPALAGVGSAALDGAVARLEERRLSTVELCLSGELAEGADVVGELTALVAEHPLREGFAGLLMRALIQRGRQADALRVYQSARRRLVDELGVEPGPRLRALHEEALRDPPEDRAGPCYLPYDLPDFTGREHEVQQLVTLLAEGAPVVVDGMAGVGKSALAVRAAHLAAPAFGDGQLFVDLHGYTPGRAPLRPEAALAALLVQLGVPANRHPGDLEGRAALWRARTAGRKLLVLLDNVVNEEQLRPLLPGTGTVAVLATSRRHLTALDGAVPVSLDLLPPATAAELFTAVSGRRDAGVAARCGYLPLAIRIAAARLRHRPQWTVEELAGRLGSAHHRLAELRAGSRDVAAAFELSYQDLTGEQRRLFRLLGGHPGSSLAVGAAAALAGLSRVDTERLLEDLLDAHLLTQRGRGAYQFHDLLAEHARSLADENETAVALDRLLDHYRDGGDEDWYAAEDRNLAAVTEHALLSGRYDHAWRIAEHATAHLQQRGRRDEFLAVARAGHTAASRAGDADAIQRSLGYLADAHWESGELAEAMACAEERLRVAESATDRASALSRLGALHGMFSRYGEARTCYREALALAGEDPALTGLILANASHNEEMLGELDEALACARRATEIRRRAGDHRGAVLSVAQEAVVLSRLRRTGEAVAVADRSVREAVELAYPFGEAWSRIDYAEVLLAAELPARAREQAERACEILTWLNHPLMLAMAANSLGTACRATGDPEAALRHHRLARDTARRIGYLAQETRADHGIAMLRE
ncbi:AfsR/SARP family transcriptional regulator [Amycolatopsis albispora]|uniref:SARP family transcriptional regulator n=1 Tax=Amycolatopsis albispora TaxID=1804986 RepID=A0A344L550_9PSEU|nr:BTAD domain-containing putative transcriptional regulator [Amycolatopsis albispora]AXB43174.1 SARP family transcriptional regulator [Amycolatopsis albispora]